MRRAVAGVLVAQLSSFLTAGAATASTDTQKKLAVMPLAAKRVPKETVEILDELLLNEVDRRGVYSVVGSSDINAMLGLDKMKEALGCDNVSCAAEIGGALGVSYLVAGSVSRLGDELIISLKLIDVTVQSVERRSQVNAPADENLYREAMETSVSQLLGSGDAGTRSLTLAEQRQPLARAGSSDTSAKDAADLVLAGGPADHFPLYSRSSLSAQRWVEVAAPGDRSRVVGSFLVWGGLPLVLSGGILAGTGQSVTAFSVASRYFAIVGLSMAGAGAVSALVGLLVRARGSSALDDSIAGLGRDDPNARWLSYVDGADRSRGMRFAGWMAIVLGGIGLVGGGVWTAKWPDEGWPTLPTAAAAVAFGIAEVIAGAPGVEGLALAPVALKDSPTPNGLAVGFAF